MSERSITFGAGKGLVGTLTLPDNPAPGAAVGILLFNAGVVHRVGPHRINVRLARQLAELGIASIRFDLAGYGDSARPGGERSFEEQAVVDIGAAMDALGAATRLTQFAIFGYCSGAYYGFAAARVDKRIAAILMYDAFRYPTLKTYAVHYWKRVRQPGLIRGIAGALGRAVGGLGRRVGAPAVAAAPPVAELGRIDFIPTKAEFATGVRALLDRGVQIHMIYSGGASNDYNYGGQFRDAFARFGLAERIEAEFMPDLDHVASGMHDQADLMRRVVAWSRSLTASGARA